MEDSLLIRLGGEEAIEAAVVRFYEKVVADPLLAPFFEGLDVKRQIATQIAVMTTVFGGGDYEDHDLRVAHAHARDQGLSEEHFETFCRLMGETLEELGVDEPMIQQVIGHMGRAKASVLDR